MAEVRRVAEERQNLRDLIGIPDFVSDEELAALFSLDRVEDFANLIMLGEFPMSIAFKTIPDSHYP